MKLPWSGANLRPADEEAGERISVDAVRGVGPLRMIRREVNRTAPAAGLCTGLVRTAGHLWEATEVEGNTVKLQLLSTNRTPRENLPTLYPTSLRRVFSRGGSGSGDNVGPGAFARSASSTDGSQFLSSCDARALCSPCSLSALSTDSFLSSLLCIMAAQMKVSDVAQPVVPVAVTPVAPDGNVRLPPPGCPPGGVFKNVEYVGPITCCITFWCLESMCSPLCCPCDTKEMYIAPDGTHYSLTGTVDEKFGPCKCC